MKLPLSFGHLYTITFALLAVTASAQTPPSLAIRENDLRVDLIFTGTHAIEAAESISGPWISLGSQTSPFTDSDSDELAHRFYRINDSGVFSANAVGYYRLDLCQGFSLIANQLNTFSNTITNVLKSVPDGTEVYKHNPTTGVYIYMVFDSGSWYASHPDTTLNPGEGIYLNTQTPFTHRFLGELPMSACVPIAPGFRVISCPLPKICPLTTGFETGFPVGDGDAVYRGIGCGGSFHYSYDAYDGGAWFGDSQGTPVMNIGEAFWLQREAANGPANWCRVFTVGP